MEIVGNRIEFVRFRIQCGIFGERSHGARIKDWGSFSAKPFINRGFAIPGALLGMLLQHLGGLGITISGQGAI